MFYRFISAVSVLLILFSCTYDTLEDTKNNSEIVIKSGTVCGWCAKDDTLTINGNSVRYVNYIDCSTTNPDVQKSGEISQTDYERLVSLLDFNALKEIDQNACNVCVDGCDSWLLIDTGTESHYIRFGGTEAELQPVKAFLDQLNLIKAQYSGDNNL